MKKQLDRNDYCYQTGLDPHLHAYPKTHDQADYLLALVERLKRNLWWSKAGHKNIKVRAEVVKTAKDMQQSLDDLIAYCDEDQAEILENILLPDPPQERTVSDFNESKKQRLWDELKDQGFKNIEKLIAAINVVVGEY